MPIINLVYEAPREWKPNANTIGYRPLNGDFNDYSGNNRNLTNSGVTFVSGGPGQVASFASGNNAYYQNNSLLNNGDAFTYNVWVKASSIPSGYYYSVHPYYSVVVGLQDGTATTSHCKDLGLCLESKAIGYCGAGTDYMNGGSISTGLWYNIVFTYDGNGNKKLYVDGVQVATETISTFSPSYSNARITLSKSASAYNSQPFVGQLSNVIVENKEWTATEVSKYYEKTKSDYKLFIYEYNLITAGSIQQMQSDGWIFSNTSNWEFTNNGLHRTSGTQVIGKSNLDLSSASLIKVTTNAYLVSGSWTGQYGFGISDTATVSSNRVMGILRAMNNQGYTGYGIEGGGSSNYDTSVTLSTGNYTNILTIDLVNKVAKIDATGLSQLTLSLSDTAISNLRAYPYLYLFFDNRGCYVKDISIDIYK